MFTYTFGKYIGSVSPTISEPLKQRNKGEWSQPRRNVVFLATIPIRLIFEIDIYISENS
jgi:hypothetical protein